MSSGGNSFISRPEIGPVILPEWWTCPITGLVVPKGIAENLEWRDRLLSQAETDLGVRQDLYTACSKSSLFFINAFCWTLRVFDGDGQSSNKHLPYITWPIQDLHILAIEDGIVNGKSLLTDKSRDMGATWNHLAVYVHRLLFRTDESHLMVSRKEDVVDLLHGLPRNYPHGTISDPGTLFGKIDYILTKLPNWMVPTNLGRKRMHLVNPDSGTRIDGESSNANVGVSDRRHSIFLDEFALVKEADAIKRGTADVSKCRLVNSAPYGPGSVHSAWRMSGTIPVFDMPWWYHPEKSKGIYIEKDKYDRYRIRSPWYDSEAAKRSPQELASQVDRDHLGSGELFFEPTSLEQHRRLFVKPPLRQCHIIYKPRTTDEAIIRSLRGRDLSTISITRDLGGPWRIWSEVQFTDWGKRPDQRFHYVMGVDISRGQGASNSAISICCVETREKIAEYADNATPPYELAKAICAAAIWCGGQGSLPEIIFESNGSAGWDFGRQLTKIYEYPKVWVDKTVGKTSDRSTKKYGFHSSPEKKGLLLGLLRRAYAHGKFINHSSEAIAEAGFYTYFPDGGIGPASDLRESKSARGDHGDRVIADSLSLWAMPQGQLFSRDEDRVVPVGSVGHRMQDHFRALKMSRREAAKNSW